MLAVREKYPCECAAKPIGSQPSKGQSLRMRGKTHRKPAIEGSGLGLTIVKHIVQSHGYSIEVHSALGSGTRFVVSLKRKNQ